jgi:hypothetical protein
VEFPDSEYDTVSLATVNKPSSFFPALTRSKLKLTPASAF